MKFCVWMAALLAVFASASLAQTKPSIEAFATLPAAESPSLSPDGKHLALIQALAGRPVATIWKLGESKPQLVIPFDEGFIVGAVWANDHRVLVTINLNGSAFGENVEPWFRTVSIDIDTRQLVVMFSDKQSASDFNYSTSTILDLAPDDPDHIYIPLYFGAGWLGTVYQESTNTVFRVDVNTGKSQFAERGSKYTRSWVMDGKGNVVVRRDRTKDPLVDHIFANTSGKDWHEIASTDATSGKGYSIWGLSEDGKSVVITADFSSTDTRGLTTLALDDGKESELFVNPKFDVDGAISDPWSGRVIGAALTMHLGHPYYFSAPLQAMQKALDDYFPGNTVYAQTWDRARKKVVVLVDGPVTPPSYYLIDLESHAVQRLARAYPQLQESDLGQMRVYNYAARDGLEIPAYLTLPPGKAPKNLPVVILPHGGPMARDSMAFDWMRQFLANRGYAVLQPNFRGSAGYGIKFKEAGYGQWGLKMQDDVTDGVKKLITDGIADPKRICIVGASYGGYAALAGAAFTPELYACAASWAGVADVRQMLKTDLHESGGTEKNNAWMSASARYIGKLSDASLDAHSPALHVDRIQAPILLMHGEDDYTVRIDQSEEMESALRLAHKKVTFVRIPKETHQMQTTNSRVRWLTELEKFLKENIGD